MPKALKVTELGDPVLRKKAKAVSAAKIKTKAFQNFLDNLVRTCDVKSGVGIAAPQVGDSERVFILWSRSNKRYKNVPKFGPIAIINPKIISTSKKLEKEFEGCLSIPGIRGLVPRHKWIDVLFTTRDGEKIRATVEGFAARIFQHEYDHLNGIVFLDRTNPKDLVTEAEFKKLLKKNKKKI
jgi:peptide deformylase